MLFAVLLIFSALPAHVSADEAVGFIAYNTGNNNNNGLSPATPKKSIGGSGVFSIVRNGGTVVICEKKIGRAHV